MAETATTPGLYQRVLADAWVQLDETVRQFHDGSVAVRAEGIFRIRHGSNWLSRLLAWLARLPLAGEEVPVQLAIVPQGRVEEWQRSFVGRSMFSRQWDRDGVLIEILGHTELRMRLNVVDGALHYESTSAALCLGPLRLPLIGWLRPRGRASETPLGPDRLRVAVEMSLPLLGRLISYEGNVTWTVAEKL